MSDTLTLHSGRQSQRRFGIYPAIVVGIDDPQDRGRIQIEIPLLGLDRSDATVWATLLSPYADDGQGFFSLPKIGSHVAVVFEAGNPKHPYIVGSYWGRPGGMPEPPCIGIHSRLWKSHTGSLLRFDDAEGGARVELSLRSGLKVVLDDQQMDVRIEHRNGSTVIIDATGKISVYATKSVDLVANAVNVRAATLRCDGTVHCTTLHASDGVVSTSYTPSRRPI